MKKWVSLLTTLVLPAIFVLSLWQVRPVLAAQVTVTTAVDENDGECVTDCSLRDAVATAVAGDEIIIPAGTYTLTLGAITIDKDLTLRDDAGVRPEISTAVAATDRIFAVTSGASVTFTNLIITGTSPAVNVNGAGIYVFSIGGSIVVSGTTVANHTTSADGGGIYVQRGNVELINSTIEGNQADQGGGVYVNRDSVTLTSGEISGNEATNTGSVAGGGVLVNQSSATFTMSGGVIQANTAPTVTNTTDFPGGGVAVVAGTANLNGGEIRENEAHRGGGVLVSDGAVTISGTDILSNTATYGGGIYIRNTGALVTHNSGRIDYNTADPAINDFGGGGIYVFNGVYQGNGGTVSHNTSTYDGGAVDVANGTAVIDGMTISENTTSVADGALGGAIHIRGADGVITITNSTLSGNIPGAMTTQGGLITAKGNTIDNHTTALLIANTGSLTAYANNITNYTVGFSDGSSGSHSVRHNWWGSGATAVSVGDTDGFSYRLGAVVSEWGEGSLAGGAAISGGTGTGVVISHGSTVPFNTPASSAGSPCSDYYDFFTAPGATGSWTVSVPVSSAAACDTTFSDTKLFHFALDGSNAPDTACTPDSACWQAYSSVTSSAGSPRLLNVSLTTAELGGTPIVAGDDSGNDPTAVSLTTIAAGSSVQTLWLSAALLLALLTAGLLWQRQPQSKRVPIRRNRFPK